MNILVTGSDGFIGKNLVEALKRVRENGDPTRPNLKIDEIFEYDRKNEIGDLNNYCADADFVFNLVGNNRPVSTEEYMIDNYGFSRTLLLMLENYHNECPVMLASSYYAIQAGIYADNTYGKAKRAAESLCFGTARKRGTKALVYRFPEVFGRGSRPNGASSVATFCFNYANGLPAQTGVPQKKLDLVYIDDLIEELLGALVGEEHYCRFIRCELEPNKKGRYCYVPTEYQTTLGEVVEILSEFLKYEGTPKLKQMLEDPFMNKLYATYQSYLPKER